MRQPARNLLYERGISELGEGIADATDDVIGRLLILREFDEADGDLLSSWTQNEGMGVQFQKSDVKRFSSMNRIYGGDLGAIHGKRFVMAINDDDRILTEQRLHRHGLYCVNTNGHKTLPEGASGGRTFARKMEYRVRDLHRFQNVGRLNARIECRCEMSHDSDGLGQRRGLSMRCQGSNFIRGEQIQHREILRGQNPIETVQTERPFPIEKVRYMGLLESRCPGQYSTGQNSAVNSAKDFKAKVLVKVAKFHGERLALRYKVSTLLSIRKCHLLSQFGNFLGVFLICMSDRNFLLTQFPITRYYRQTLFIKKGLLAESIRPPSSQLQVN